MLHHRVFLFHVSFMIFYVSDFMLSAFYIEKAEGIAASRFFLLFKLYVLTMAYFFHIIQFLEPSWHWPLS